MNPKHLHQPADSGHIWLNRRQLLRAGSLGLIGVSLPKLLAARAGENQKGTGLAARADHCIVIFLNGGPSHLDMWDMKPEAPVEVRGEFKSISSSLPGVQVCELMPRLSKLMHLSTLIRSMNHSVNNAHALAVYTALTGHDRGDATVAVGNSSDDHPALGSILTRMRPSDQDIVPYVALPYKTKEGVSGPPQPGFFGGLLGDNYDPLWVLRNPNSDDFSVPELTLRKGITPARLANRGRLLEQLDASRWNTKTNPSWKTMNQFQHQAIDLLTSTTAQQAVCIDREPVQVREAYGRNIYGQSVLLARRLVEAGTRLVTISWAPDANATWDTHSANFRRLKDSLLPEFDAAASSLITDLEQRGLLERTVVAIMGDFGRTPKINNNEAGRDHWNYCYTIMMVGGGFRPGFVYGSSDKQGAFPQNLPVTPGDVIATIYHALGIDHRQEFHDRLDRPHLVVPEGNVVENLLV